MKKIKEFLNESVLRKIILIILLIPIAMNTILYFVSVSQEYGGSSIWTSIVKGTNHFSIAAIVLLFLYIFGVIFYISTIVIYAVKKDLLKKVLKVYVFYNLFHILVYMILSIFLKIYSSKFMILFILNLILSITAIIFYIYYNKRFKDEDSNKNANIETIEKTQSRLLKFIMLIISTLGLVLVIVTYFLPLFNKNNENFTLFKILKGTGYAADEYALALLMLAISIICLIIYVFNFMYYKLKNNIYIKKAFRYNSFIFLVGLLYFIFGVGFTFVYKIKKISATTMSFIPLIFFTILSIISAFIYGIVKEIRIKDKKTREKKRYRFKRKKIFPLIFSILFTTVTICSIFFCLIEVNFVILGTTNYAKIKGLTLLKGYADLNKLYQVMTFVYALMIFTSAVLLFLCITSYLGKTKEYYKIVKATVYTNAAFMFTLSIVAIFFIFNQKIIDSSVRSIIEYLGIYIPELYKYKINSQIFIPTSISFFLLALMLITGQLNHTLDDVLSPNFNDLLEEKEEETSGKNEVEKEDSPIDEPIVKDIEIEDIDPCPVFTEIDSNIGEYNEKLEEKKKSIFINPTLPKLVDFIVEYARDSRLHLSYSHEDIATFISGLGASRLTILQGMSGTGKTSLPKIFAEAIMGNCEIIEVESSWRDKNELIGYYNEFSKVFTPKKFTQSLYKAKLNNNIPTFIVLDEMNLSRIEYYFSDFLSLMEAEEHKREFKLLNIKLNPSISSGKESYIGLANGHTIEIPKNVWFIGTANRDESTFEISDKVYDRAQTMNFSKRAPKVRSYKDERLPQFLPYEEIESLFKEAKKNFVYDAENDPIIQEVENLLSSYNISFGNRILNQIEEFVKIFCSCFISENEMGKKEILNIAVENILFSKVVRKLEVKQIDNKEKLAIAFDKLQLFKCSAFIRKLDEE